MKTVKWCIVLAGLLSVSATSATAGVGVVLNAAVASVTSLPLPFGQGALIHKPGNMEIVVQGGFTLPEGVTCDTLFITTLASVDPDKSMFQLLTAAITNGQRVNLGITDDPQYTAFTGRCSLVFVTLIKKP